MKIEIDDNELVEAIVEKVTARLKPSFAASIKSNSCDELLTVESLAKYLTVSKQWVYERVHLNEIPFIKMKKFPRFKKLEIDKWLDTMKTHTMQPFTGSLKMVK